MASESCMDKLHVDMWHLGLPSARKRKHVGGERLRKKDGGPLISGWPTPINMPRFKLPHVFVFVTDDTTALKSV